MNCRSFFERSIEAANSNQTPTTLRVIILLGFLGMSVLFFYVAFDLKEDSGALVGFMGMGIVFNIFFLTTSYRLIKVIIQKRKLQQEVY